MRIVALIDYDNVREGRYRNGTGGRGPSRRDHFDFLTVLVDALIDYQNELTSDFCEFTIRLYSGWSYPNGVKTDTANMVSSAISEHGFPTRTRRSRVFVTVADHPIVSVSERLDGTLRNVPAAQAPRFQMKDDLSCPRLGTNCESLEAINS